MPQPLSDEEIARIASLARLALTREETRQMATDLAEILAFAGQIAALDTSMVAPSDNWISQVSVERPDEPASSLDVEAALGNAPEKTAELFLTPGAMPGSW